MIISADEAEARIRKILANTYGSFVQKYMPPTIIEQWSTGTIKTEADLARHIWYTTSGGTTAALKAKEISQAIPGFVTESDLSKW